MDRSTLAFWVGVAAAEVKPVYQRLKEVLLGSAKIAVDETRAPVLDPGRGRVKPAQRDPDRLADGQRRQAAG